MVQFLEQLSSLERLSLIQMSSSRISSYQSCPSKYFYDYIILEPRGHNKWSILGNVLHSVLEATDFTHPLNYLDMLNLFEDYKAEYDLDNEITPDLINDAHQMLADFIETNKGIQRPIIAKEMPFAIVIGPALVVGYIDQIEELPGNVIKLTDLKSGRNEVAAKNVPNDFQLGIYALALKKLYPNHRIIAQLDYLRSGRIKSHEFSDANLEQMEIRLINTINEIMETNNFKYTANIHTCRFCSFAETGTCEVGRRRIEKLNRN